MRQEMRSFVCGQCHVEYYCGKGITLFFPWDEGLKVEQIEHHYNSMQVHGARFKDWVHAETGMEVLKAQHPEFELWSPRNTCQERRGVCGLSYALQARRGDEGVRALGAQSAVIGESCV
jgi:formate-dependent nitrite reductase cytochrome c552 subunit